MADALKTFDTVEGTNVLKAHYNSNHVERSGTVDSPFKVPAALKRTVTNAALFSVVQVILPLSFSSRQIRMVSFAEALVTASRTVAPNVPVDVPALIPSPPTVREGFPLLLDRLRKSFKRTLPYILKVGVGMTFDGIKLETNGIKYYDLIIYYISVPEPGAYFTAVPKPVMGSQVISITGHKGAEFAQNLRASFDAKLQSSVNCTMQLFLYH